MTHRPRRKRKDVLLTGSGSVDHNANEMWAVLAPLDATAREMEAKWGIGRLPEVVGEDMARKFGAAMEVLDQAIDSDDVDATAVAAGNLRKGWLALDAEATRLGARPYSPEAWGFSVGQHRAAVIRDGGSVQAMKQLDPDCAVYTLEEVGSLLAQLFRDQYPAIAEAKNLFPGAVASVVDKPPPSALAGGLDDEIPF